MGRYVTSNDVLQDLQGNYAPGEWAAVEADFDEWLYDFLEEVWNEGASNYYGVNPYGEGER